MLNLAALYKWDFEAFKILLWTFSSIRKIGKKL